MGEYLFGIGDFISVLLWVYRDRQTNKGQMSKMWCRFLSGRRHARETEDGLLILLLADRSD
jgi:hypothetical protein